MQNAGLDEAKLESRFSGEISITSDMQMIEYCKYKGIYATGALSAAERSYPTSEVRGRSREDPVPEGLQPKGVTPRLRSGAVAKSARLRWCSNGREELPCFRGQGRPGGATLCPRLGAAARRSNPMPKARGGDWEEQPHAQRAVAARAQEGLEELFHVQGQEWRW